LRVTVDESSETVGKKIRAAELMRVNYTLVVGDKEIEAGTLAVRGREGKPVPGVSVEDFLDRVAGERDSRSLEPSTF
ncbi:MAG: His/Gly/Thr/Pro-type tRNA ligase C-terminal domain-containing protein, partial [Actinomycetota bacterium]